MKAQPTNPAFLMTEEVNITQNHGSRRITLPTKIIQQLLRRMGLDGREKLIEDYCIAYPQKNPLRPQILPRGQARQHWEKQDLSGVYAFQRLGFNTDPKTRAFYQYSIGVTLPPQTRQGKKVRVNYDIRTNQLHFEILP